MKIAFIPANVSGVSFYRVWQPAEALRKLGHQVAVLWYQHSHLRMHPWEEDLVTKDTSIVQDVHMAYQWADCVVWQAIHTPQALQLIKDMKSLYRKPTLTELDDYLFTLPETHAAAQVYYPGSTESAVAYEQIKLSDALVVSTPYLKEAYAPLNSRIYVVENTIDFTLWRKHPPRLRQGTNLTIGWMGGGSHNDDLALLLPVIPAIGAQFPHIRWKFISGGPCPDSFKNIPKVKWVHAFQPINKYPGFMAKQGFDIGVAPLVDNTFNRTKSNLRWLELTALGVPVVASDVEHFKTTTALLCTSPEDWVYHLGYLIEDLDHREFAINVAETRVKEQFLTRHAAQKYTTILKEVMQHGKSDKRGVAR